MASVPKGLNLDESGVPRCWWVGEDLLYRQYHDREWGFPVRDDRLLFERICLEGFQAGLSWLTILRKRDHFRRAFAGFEIDAVARFNRRSLERLLADPGIVRHRGKIESTINNARRALAIVEEFGSLAAYLWSFEPQTASRPRRITRRVLRSLTRSPESVALSRDLKQRGWSFVGPTTLYALMQATGMVNDHVEECATRAQAEAARAVFIRPQCIERAT